MFLSRFLLLPLLALSSIAVAHDPKLHEQEKMQAEQPADCSKANTATPSKDPISQAIAQKCNQTTPSTPKEQSQMKEHKMDNTEMQHMKHMQH